ncbi:DUF2811 domain-containing protein [Prochlorococcus sp. MIT 1223]|uniref:DUF2811 domain-containing protein n=1 Tax=Prochlorococcus sp. MIT 1223 TaxID=3096217 RepID=UPI002A75F18E|nr:DUF2811 domain-containing protein [Prochlorococcus sp. MIT 1223]|tara:strand:- start:273 stop:557 length:285 start_codon:yes stop_codon:yes gene_type:complete
MELCNLEALKSNTCSLEDESTQGSESIVSFHAKVPVQLQLAMNSFIERYPNWDQYRLIQAALAGFLVQQGFQSRSVTRLYVGNMFSLNTFRSNG